MINTEEKEKNILHFAGHNEEIEECHLQIHGPFLMCANVSHEYASAVENKFYCTAACLKCGRIDAYQLSREERRLIININKGPLSFDNFYTVRKRYLELQSQNIEPDEIVAIINEEYKNEEKIDSPYQKLMKKKI